MFLKLRNNETFLIESEKNHIFIVVDHKGDIKSKITKRN